MKVMADFKAHHNLPVDIPPPSGSLIHHVFSYVVDLMAHSMGYEKREVILQELESYKNDLPFDLR